MKIDWFTIVAQALNFLVLLWLMKRFLYKPILRAIDEREKRIAQDSANAEASKADAQKLQEEYEGKNEELDRRRAALLKEAQDEARSERLRLLEEAREAAEAYGLKRREALRAEELASRKAVRLRTRDEVFAIARKTLADLAGTSLEERMVEVFAQRLRGLGEDEKKALASASEARSGPVTVRTGFALSPERLAPVEAAIKEIIGAEAIVAFETAPDSISGIELLLSGRKVAWSIASYLTAMEAGIADLLKDRDEGSPSKAKASVP